MSKIQTVESAEHAKDAVKTTADRANSRIRREPIRKTLELWARIQNAFSALIETIRGK